MAPGRQPVIIEPMRALFVVLFVAGAAHAGDNADTIANAAPSCDKARAHCFALHVHIAADANGLVANAAWLTAQLAGANRHFTPLDVGFQLAGIDALPESAMHVETRADRNALAANRLGGKSIHVFVVGQLDDVDVEGEVRYGVVWRRPKDPRRYVIISVQALERTLAHELGHFFGLPHSTYAVSIMNKTERKEPPLDQRTFASEEIAAMRPILERLVRNKVIVAVPAR
jgi:hypothetical protein